MAATSSSIVNGVVAELTRALLPLSRLDSADRVDAMLLDLGWDLPGVDSLSANVDQLAAGVDTARELIDAFERGTPTEQLVAVVEMIAAITEIVTSLDELLGEIESVVAGDVIDDSGIRELFVRRLIDYLVSCHLERNRPGLDAVVHVLGIAERSPQPAVPETYQPEFVLRRIWWDRLPLLLSDPMALSEVALGWGSGFDAPPFVERIGDLVRSIRLPGGIYPQDPELAAALERTEVEPQELRVPLQHGGLWPDAYFEAGVGVSPLLPGSPNGVGLAFVPYFFGDWQGSFELGGGWRLEITGGVDAGLGPALLLHPPIEVELRSDVLGDGAGSDEELRVELALVREQADGDAMVLFGAEDATRLDLESIRLAVVAERVDGEDELAVSAELGQLGLALLTAGGDSFAKALLPIDALDGTFDLKLAWSSRTGFDFDGSTSFDVVIPVHRSIGPVTLDVLGVRISIGDGGEIIARFTGDLSVTLLVFAAEVEGFGVKAVLSFPEAGGNLGPLDIAFGIAPPTRVAFEIAAGAVNGGGFVEYLEDTGQYVGGLSLDVLAVGIDAFTIVDTALPGDPDGYALFATLTLRFPSIPLGFGFSLSGLGGLLALNRSVDTEALALGLRDGAADAILFPENILRDCHLLVSQIDEYFPLLAGNTVVGPVAEIRWGVGDMVIGQLGVAISFPQNLIMVLASIEAVLPDRVAPVLELHLDVLGVIDLEGGSLLIVGSLYDSRLLSTIELSGDTALYVSWGADPYFVLSVGGFHPGFTPPAHTPAILEELRPMRAEVDLGLGVTAAIEAYFAVTSNTVQFGGGFEIEASAEFLLVKYTARGWFDFDVLLQFSPFLILADASAGVGVYAGQKELMGVSLTVYLEGPQPWFASGTARFTFFSVKVKFDFAVGGHAPPEPRGSSDVLTLACTELANPASWTAVHSTTNAGLLLAGDAVDDRLRPDDVLVGRQTIAPFERTIARYGETTPLQSTVSVRATSVVSVIDRVAGDAIGELDVTDALDWFAPAQYDVLPDAARLSSPSYEQMIAGVSIGGTSIETPGESPIVAPEGHETKVWSPATGMSIVFTDVEIARPLTDTIAASWGAGAVVAATRATTDVARVELAGQTYVAIDTTTGLTVSDELSYAAAVDAASALTGARVVPAHAGVAS
jgi:hypothetical protein